MQNLKQLLIATVAAFLCLPLFAEGEDNILGGNGRFADNWFVSGGAGVNGVFSVSAFPPVGLAAEFSFGKWIIPSLGLRLGFHGLKNRPNGVATGWFSGEDRFWYGHTSLDVLWNINSTFGGYNPRRFWNISPYARAGVIAVAQEEEGVPHWMMGGGAGLYNTFRVSRRVDLYIDLSAMFLREKAVRERGSVATFPTATAGIAVKIGRQGFAPKRVSEKVLVEVERTIVQVDTVTVVDETVIREMRSTPLTLYFEIDQTVLTDREKAHLERYAHFVLTPDTKVHLTGSADKETGDSAHNQWLSEKRNETVRGILMSVYGLKRENISETANGDRMNEFDTSEKNRCVTITILED